MMKLETGDNMKNSTQQKSDIVDYVVDNMGTFKEILIPLEKEKEELFKTVNPLYHDDIRNEFYTNCVTKIAHITSKETGTSLDEVYCALDNPLAIVDTILGKTSL